MASDGTGTIYIPMECWADFLEDEWSPAPKGAVTEYSPPRLNEDTNEIEVDYAFGTDVSPCDWAEKPAWLTKACEGR